MPASAKARFAPSPIPPQIKVATLFKRHPERLPPRYSLNINCFPFQFENFSACSNLCRRLDYDTHKYAHRRRQFAAGALQRYTEPTIRMFLIQAVAILYNI
jgi:hypothetical protein